MRASIIIVAALALAGCSVDPCNGVSGTCVGLTITSRAVNSVDTFDLTASGALSRHIVSAAGHATSLPVHMALTFGNGSSGLVKLAIVGQRAGSSLAVGSTTFTLTPGKHVSATADIEPINGGGPIDLAGLDNLGDGGGGGSGGTGGGGGSGGSGGTGGGGDMMPTCDPNGVTGPACVWRYLNPYPTAEDIVVIRKISDIRVYALTSLGLVLRKNAMGWTPITTTPGNFRATALAVSSGGDIYIAGDKLVNNMLAAGFFHSADDGQTWTEEALPAAVLAQHINALSASGQVVLGACTSGWIIFRAFDGTWSAQQKETVDFHSAFWDAQLGAWVGSFSGTIWSGGTSPSAPTWTKVTTPNAGTAQLNGICGGKSAGGSRLWAVGFQSTVVSASLANAPTTWTAQTTGVPANSAFYDCTASDDMTAWFVGTDGTGGVYSATTNGGTNWSGQTSQPGPDLAATVFSIDVKNGSSLTMAGRGGTIQSSANAGSTWASDSKGHFGPFRNMAEVAPGVIFVVGDNATIYRTIDNGATWAQAAYSYSGTPPNFRAVWGSSLNDVFIVGDAGTILHATDGMTFTKYAGAEVANTVYLNDIAGSTKTGIFAVGFQVGGGYNVYRTTNDGMTWSAVTVSGGAKTLTLNANESPFIAAFAMSAGLWIGSTHDQMFFTADGTTWTPQTITNTTGIPADFMFIRGREPNELFALTHTANQALLVHSTDGTTWTVLPATTLHDQQLYLAVTPTGDAIWTAGGDGLEFSVDHGMTFTHPISQVVDSTQSGDALIARAANDVFYLTEKGGVAHYGN